MNARIENLVIPGYQIIEQLYVGAKTIVYRAIRSVDDYKVVIKILASEYPTFNELLHFRNQYTLAKNLNIPGIVSPVSLEAYRNGYMLVMEDFGAISLHKYAKNLETLQISDFLNIAIQLADILDNLYHWRVIHKDIKPANILIHPESKLVKLIDFSIASYSFLEMSNYRLPITTSNAKF